MLKVIGLGNALRGDDSIGPHIIETLNENGCPVPCTLIDAGSDAFTLLEHLIDKDPLLIIDCAEMGKEPGTYVKFTLNDSTLKTVDSAVSLHGFSFGEVYKIAKSMGSVAECQIIGIQPKNIEFNLPLSEEVSKIIPTIINLVIEEAKHYA